MKVAAYQAPLLPCGSMEAVDLIRGRIAGCEEEGVEILCCPEAVLGGLADYAADPAGIAIGVEGGELDTVLAPLASAREGRVSCGSSAIVAPDGGVLRSARRLAEDLLVAEIGIEKRVPGADGRTSFPS